MITKNDILKYSRTYYAQHGITNADVLKANKLHDLIRATRLNNKPMPGDIMICQGPAKTYHNGHIDLLDLSLVAAIWTQPYTPFVFESTRTALDIHFDASGGYWLSIPKDKLNLINHESRQIKLFKTWGHKGVCVDGAFTFPCKVNVWSYYSDDIY